MPWPGMGRTFALANVNLQIPTGSYAVLDTRGLLRGGPWPVVDPERGHHG